MHRATDIAAIVLIELAVFASSSIGGRAEADFPEEDAYQLYKLAEQQLKDGEERLAEETAKRAFELEPENPQQHVVCGYQLQQRGLFAWAEREFRHVLRTEKPASVDSYRARLLLSEMLHDIQRDSDAAEVLHEVVEMADEDARTLRARLGREPNAVRARMHYFSALGMARKGEKKKQVEHLRKAVDSSPTDADALIALHKAGDMNSVKLIEAALKRFREQIDQHERQAAEAKNDALRSYQLRQVASVHNQLAWLIANTQGDLDQALKSSQRALEIRPKTPGYLDTLAHCYFAKSDYASAVKYQALAVKGDPHSRQIRRHLELFKQKLTESKQGDRQVD